jgi:hypothetical protein
MEVINYAKSHAKLIGSFYDSLPEDDPSKNVPKDIFILNVGKLINKNLRNKLNRIKHVSEKKRRETWEQLWNDWKNKRKYALDVLKEYEMYDGDLLFDDWYKTIYLVPNFEYYSKNIPTDRETGHNIMSSYDDDNYIKYKTEHPDIPNFNVWYNYHANKYPYEYFTSDLNSFDALPRYPDNRYPDNIFDNPRTSKGFGNFQSNIRSAVMSYPLESDNKNGTRNPLMVSRKNTRKPRNNTRKNLPEVVDNEHSAPNPLRRTSRRTLNQIDLYKEDLDKEDTHNPMTDAVNQSFDNKDTHNPMGRRNTSKGGRKRKKPRKRTRRLPI